MVNVKWHDVFDTSLLKSMCTSSIVSMSSDMTQTLLSCLLLFFSCSDHVTSIPFSAKNFDITTLDIVTGLGIEFTACDHDSLHCFKQFFSLAL